MLERIFKSLVLVCVFVGSIICQQIIDERVLFPARHLDKCGYINKTGKIIIPLKYEHCNDFSEGLAAVVINEKVGFIDVNGQFVIRPQFPDSGHEYGYSHDIWGGSAGFSEGIAKILSDPVPVANLGAFRKVGYIDKTGRTIIQPQFNNAGDFINGLARVDTISKPYFFIDNTGRSIIWGGPRDVPHNASNWREFHEGLSMVDMRAENNSWSDTCCLGFMDTAGRLVYSASYSSLGDFHEGFAFFSKHLDPPNDRANCGYLDRTFTEIIAAKFFDCEDFYDGRAAVLVKSNKSLKLGFIDQNGKFVVKPQFDEPGPDFAGEHRYSEAFAAVCVGDLLKRKCGYVDKDGHWVITAKFDIAKPFHSGIAKVMLLKPNNHIPREMLTGYIDKTGKYIWQPQ